MKLRLSPIASDITICIYLSVSLYYRFILESERSISPINSIFLGASFLTILWFLIKIKLLNPNWFGFFNSNGKKN